MQIKIAQELVVTTKGDTNATYLRVHQDPFSRKMQDRWVLIGYLNLNIIGNDSRDLANYVITSSINYIQEVYHQGYILSLVIDASKLRLLELPSFALFKEMHAIQECLGVQVLCTDINVIRYFTPNFAKANLFSFPSNNLKEAWTEFFSQIAIQTK